MLAKRTSPQQSDDVFTRNQVLNVQYLWDIRCDGDSKEVHGHIHPSHHGDKQAVARIAMGAQALLQSVKQKIFVKRTSGPDDILVSTHTSYSSVCEESRCQAAEKPSHLQGAHVGATCERSSRFLRVASTNVSAFQSIPIRAVWPFSCMRNSCPQSVAAVFTPNTTR